MELWEKFFVTLLGLTALGGIAVVGRAISSEGAVDYCWVETRTTEGTGKQLYMLMGHRPWRTDARVGGFETFDSAVQAAERINCPFR